MNTETRSNHPQRHRVERKLCVFYFLCAITALALAGCSKDGDVIYKTDPTDVAPTSPLVTVVYDPNAVGDGNYDDLIYQGVEQAAKAYGLRTMQLSPTTRAEGLAYLESLFNTLSNPQDTIRRLLIVGANPKGEAVAGAMRGFADGYTADYITYPERLGYQKTLVTEYLSDEAGSGFTVTDTTAMRVMYSREWASFAHLLVPVCGGAARTFQYMSNLLAGRLHCYGQRRPLRDHRPAIWAASQGVLLAGRRRPAVLAKPSRSLCVAIQSRHPRPSFPLKYPL